MNTRVSIQIPGFKHGENPIPAASRLGHLLVSGAIFGLDLASGKMPDGLVSQCANAFAIMGKLLAAGGADFTQVIKVTFYLRSGENRAVINTEWVKCFPDPASRPARHVVINDALPAGQVVQLDFLAVVDELK